MTKRHRPDKFLLTHAVDGFSLALDFKVTRKQGKTGGHAAGFRPDRAGGGRTVLLCQEQRDHPETARRFLGEETIEKFRALKKRTDPDHLLESDLYRRVFG